MTNHAIAAAQQNLQIDAQTFVTCDIHTAILDDMVTGEAREVAQVYGTLAGQVHQHGMLFMALTVLISDGECTVTIPPGVTGGRGGRCVEFLLSLDVTLGGIDGIYALAADTDGIDGSKDNTDALLDPGSTACATAKGVATCAALDTYDAYGFFAVVGDLVVTGPARTSVNDYRVVLIL